MKMNLGTNLFIAYIIYIISTYITLVINKEKRKEHKSNRERLHKLRNIAVKTDEEQKEFINLKYPKTPPFKWSFKNVGLFILKAAIMISIFIGARYLWKTYIGWLMPLLMTFIVMALLPILINKVLKKFNLEQDDLSIY